MLKNLVVFEKDPAVEQHLHSIQSNICFRLAIIENFLIFPIQYSIIEDYSLIVFNTFVLKLNRVFFCKFFSLLELPLTLNSTSKNYTASYSLSSFRMPLYGSFFAHFYCRLFCDAYDQLSFHLFGGRLAASFSIFDNLWSFFSRNVFIPETSSNTCPSHIHPGFLFLLPSEPVW